MKKKLIIVGNKEITKDVSEVIESFDCIVRLNRMNNYGFTGTRTDILLADIHKGFLRLCTKPYDKYLNAKHLIYNMSQKFLYTERALKQNIFSINQILTSTRIFLTSIINSVVDAKTYINTQTQPTNFFLLTKYIIDNYSSDYEIWITAIDLQRSVLLQTSINHKNTLHRNAGKIEEHYLQKWISKNIIKYLDIDKI